LTTNGVIISPEGEQGVELFMDNFQTSRSVSDAIMKKEDELLINQFNE